MSAVTGPLEWTGLNLFQHPPGSGRLHPVLDGEQLERCWIKAPVSFNESATGGRFVTKANTIVTQEVWRKPQQPISMRPLAGTLQIEGNDPEVYFLWQRCVGRVVQLWMSIWLTDQWLLDGATDDNEAWQLSRPFAWDAIAGVDGTTHVGRCLLDAAEFTIDYAPTPDDPLVIDNAYLLDRDNSGGEPDAIQTISKAGLRAAYPSAQRLILRYPPDMRVRIDAISPWSYRRENDLAWTVQWSEVLRGSFSAIDPGPGVILDGSAL